MRCNLDVAAHQELRIVAERAPRRERSIGSAHSTLRLNLPEHCFLCRRLALVHLVKNAENRHGTKVGISGVWFVVADVARHFIDDLGVIVLWLRARGLTEAFEPECARTRLRSCRTGSSSAARPALSLSLACGSEITNGARSTHALSTNLFLPLSRPALVIHAEGGAQTLLAFVCCNEPRLLGRSHLSKQFASLGCCRSRVEVRNVDARFFFFFVFASSLSSSAPSSSIAGCGSVSQRASEYDSHTPCALVIHVIVVAATVVPIGRQRKCVCLTVDNFRSDHRTCSSSTVAVDQHP